MDAPEPGQLVELRSYTIVPGGVDAFAEHFENHFLESQEELGMDIVGQFRVVDDAERFVWLRRYLEPSSRGVSLQRFYTGPVWERFGPRANELMVDYSDVHLLVPDESAPAFAANHVPHAERREPPPAGSATGPPSTVVAAFYQLNGTRRIPARMATAMTAAVHRVPAVAEVGRLVTAAVENDFPHLPVHEDVDVAVWLLSDGDGRAATAVAQAVAGECDTPLRTVLLSPTGRSTVR